MAYIVPNTNIKKGYVAHVTDTSQTLKVDMPHNAEIDLANSDFKNGVIKFKTRDLTYTGILEYLIEHNEAEYVPSNEDNCSERLQAIGALINTAKYLNNGWRPEFKKPDMSDVYEYVTDLNWYIYSESTRVRGKVLTISHSSFCNGAIAYFKTKELAEQAIQILGEDLLHTALGDY